MSRTAIKVHESPQPSGDTLAVYRDGGEAVVVRTRGNGKASYVAATLPWTTAAGMLEVAA